MKFLGGAVLCALALVACSHATKQASSTLSLRIAGNRSTIELAPVLLAADELGLRVQSGGIPDLYGDPVLGAPPMSPEAIVDVATNAETQALRISVNHPDLRIIMTVSEGLYRIVAKRSAHISKLADLKGKRIGTLPNTSAAYFLHEMLKSAGLSESDVKIVSLWPMDAYKTALQKGDVDAVAIWEPGSDYAAQALGSDAIEFDGKGIYRELFNLNTTEKTLADSAMRKRIVAFVARVTSASDELKRDPAAAQALAAKSSGYSLETVKSAWRHHNYPGALTPDLLDVLMEEEAWLAKDARRAPRTRDELARLIDPSVLAEARALLSN